jgi:HEPN domain-containing protein
MNDKVKYWLDLSNEDITVAEVLNNGEKHLYAGFMCHLAAEKALKAKIQNDGITPLKIHNLIRLAEIGSVLDIMEGGHKKLLTALNPLQIEARYPEYKKDVESIMTVEKCTSFIAQTKGFVQWIEKLL